MPYTPPQQWQHGDYPTATAINKYKTGLDAIHDMWGDKDFEYSIMHLSQSPPLAGVGEYHSFWLINRYRYLVYRGEMTIHDPDNVFDTVSLTDSDWIGYDLSSIEWIIPGKLYEVQGAGEAYESFDGS
jgi:hypothetical protein